MAHPAAMPGLGTGLDGASQRTLRFWWTTFGFAVLALIGLAACELLHFASHASAKSSNDVPIVAFNPTLPALRPGNLLVRPKGLLQARAPRVQHRPALPARMQQGPSPSAAERLRQHESRLAGLRLAAIAAETAALRNEAVRLSLDESRLAELRRGAMKARVEAELRRDSAAIENDEFRLATLRLAAIKAETAAISNEAATIALETEAIDLREAMKAEQSRLEKLWLAASKAETVNEKELWHAAIKDEVEAISLRMQRVELLDATHGEQKDWQEATDLKATLYQMAAQKTSTEKLGKQVDLAAEKKLAKVAEMDTSEANAESVSFPQVRDRNIVAETKWLKLLTLTYADAAGETRQWDAVDRATAPAPSSNVSQRTPDAVAILAMLRSKSQKEVNVVLVRQFRPPVNAHTIEFPAGLVDKGESPADAALREFKEETGYEGVVQRASAPMALSPGLTSETVIIVHVDVDLDLPANQHPIPVLEEGEYVDRIVVPLSELSAMLDQREMDGDIVFPALRTFALGLSFQQSSIGSAAAGSEMDAWDGEVDEDAHFDSDEDDDLPDWREARQAKGL